MQVTETSAEGLKREFKIVVPASDLQSKMDARLEELGRSVRLPGFRPGKVPLALLKKRFGASVMGELVERTVAATSTRALEERGLRPAGQPKVEITSFSDGSDLEYKLAVELIPDIKPIDFSTLSLERLVVDVGEAEIEEALRRLAERVSQPQPPAEPRPAREGDVLVIDFEGRIDGAPFQGGSGTGQYLQLGAGGFVPGFEEQLAGASAGEERKVVVTFPADYGNKEVAGRTAEFDVKVRDVLERVPVPIDDELAKKLGFDDLAALREAQRNQLAADYAGLARQRLKRQLLDVLAEAHDFEVPAGLVEAEFDAIWRQIEADREAGRLDPEDVGKPEEQLKEEYRAIARRRVKLGLLLSEVGRLNNVQVANEEVSRALLAEARRYPGQERKVIEFYQSSPQAMLQLRAPIYEDKVIDFIIETAKVSERHVSPSELAQELASGATPAESGPAGA
ncbi:MAG: trigger factor [Rhodospirillaceae bacterium]|nr:trigger factor [Rhodospirillaceae bacterium]